MTPDRYKIIYDSKYDNNDNISHSSTTPSAISSPISQNYYYNKYHEGLLELAKGFLKLLSSQVVHKTMLAAVAKEN